ncbi:hypothetical protein GCM10009548_29190 [Streptomyces malaysiensis subsp. malaysiensis]
MDPARRDGGLGTAGVRMASGGKPTIGKNKQRGNPAGGLTRDLAPAPTQDLTPAPAGSFTPTRTRDRTPTAAGGLTATPARGLTPDPGDPALDPARKFAAARGRGLFPGHPLRGREAGACRASCGWGFRRRVAGTVRGVRWRGSGGPGGGAPWFRGGAGWGKARPRPTRGRPTAAPRHGRDLVRSHDGRPVRRGSTAGPWEVPPPEPVPRARRRSSP